MRLPTTDSLSSARLDHLRILFDSITTGTMNIGKPITIIPSVGIMRFAHAEYTMKPTDTAISKGAWASSWSTIWIICWTCCGSPVHLDISCPTSMRPWNCIDWACTCFKTSQRMSFTVRMPDHARQ